MKTLPAAAAVMASLAGCSLIPRYQRPPLPVSQAWPDGPASASVRSRGAEGLASAPDTGLGWHDFFTGPIVRDLIELSLRNNRDLRVAILNVQQAQAQFRFDRASLFPTVDAAASYQYSKTAGDVYGSPFPQTQRKYGLDASVVSWELDLFGQIRSQARQAEETFLAEVDTRQSSQLSLVAQVGSEYLTWLADRESLDVSRETVARQGDSLRLTQLETAQGTATALTTAQAEATLRTAQASAAQYERQVAQDMDQLVLLVGAPLPANLLARMAETPRGLRGEPPFPDLPAGLPSDMLRRRPDIRAAEHVLLGANANIGAARAAFFPQVTLTANDGTASSSLRRLFAGGQASWLFEPNITVPIFDAGRNFANLDIAKVQKRIEVANYEKTIQTAFHDVSDALAARATYVDQLRAEEALVVADGRYYRLSNMRFKAGVDTYLNVLVAQNALFSAELSLIGLRLALSQNEVALFKALGGEWPSTAGRKTARL